MNSVVSRFAFLTGLFFIFLISGPVIAQQNAQPSASPAATASQPPIKVSTRVLKPFVFHEDKLLTGFSIELWRAIARELNVKFDFIEIKTLPDLLASVKDGKADLAISAISITASREKIFDFSQPMFDAGLQILVSADKSRGGGLAQAFHIYKATGLFHLLGILFILMLVPVPLIWWIERKHARNLFKADRKHKEWANSLWWSSTTLAGQATDMPNSPLGRVVALIWMFIGILFISYFTASVTTALTVNKLESSIKGPDDLAGKKVAAIKGSTGASFLKARNIQTAEFDNVDGAIAALTGGKVAAVVYDSPILLYYASHEGKGKVVTAGPVFRPEAYGVLFRPRSSLRKPVNAALLKLRESGEFRSLYLKYFSAQPN